MNTTHLFPALAGSPTGDATTDAVIPAASALVWAVRRGDPDAVDAALDDAVTAAGGPGVGALLVVLAAMVPDDRTPTELLAWRQDEATYLELRHHGFGADAAVNAMRLHPVTDRPERTTA